MDRIFALIARFIWVIVGFVVAIYAAGGFMVLTTGIWRNLVGVGHVYAGDSMVSSLEIALVVGVTGSLIGRAFLLPAAVAIIVAEVFRLRGALPHLLGGVLVAFIAGSSGDILPNVHGSVRRGWEILMATGVVAGGVYWLIAGMRSGAWQKRLPAMGRGAEGDSDASGSSDSSADPGPKA